MYFDFLYDLCLEHFSFEEEMSEIWSKTYIGLHVQYPLFSSYFNKTSIFSTHFRKYSNIKFHENPPSESRVVQCERRDGQTRRRKQPFSVILRTCLKMSPERNSRSLRLNSKDSQLYDQLGLLLLFCFISMKN